MASHVWRTTNDGGIKCLTLTPDNLPGALEVMRLSFIINECVMTGLMLSENQEASTNLQEICKLISVDGVSIVAVEKSTGRIVGVAFNKMQTLPADGEESFMDILRDKYSNDSAISKLIDYLEYMDSRVSVFERYNVDTVLEHFFLAVLPEYRGKGLGNMLVESTVAMARNLKVENVFANHPRGKDVGAVVATFTSRISQRIGRTLGWDELATVGYDHFTYAGKTFGERIGPDHPDSVVMAKRIDIV